MKHFYSILLAFVFSMLGIEASAFTLYLEIDEPSRISSVTTFPAQASEVDYSTGKCCLTFSDDSGMRYVYITPATDKYITSWSVCDEDGNELDSENRAKKSRVYVAVPAAADYGTLVVKTADELTNDSKITVNLTGDPSKVTFSLGAQRTIDLHEGVNEIEYVSGLENGSIYIMPVGVRTLYRVAHNGEVVEPLQGWGDAFQYNIYYNNGDVIDIETDFPDIYYTCTIAVPEELDGIIKKVTVDGALVEDWANMSIHIGSTLEVRTSRDFRFEAFNVNGVNKAYDEWMGTVFWGHSWSTVVTGDIAIDMVATKIERNLTLYTKTYDWDGIINYEDLGGGGSGIDMPTPMMTLDLDEGFGVGDTPNVSNAKAAYTFLRSDNAFMPLPVGEGSFKFCEEDNPFELSIMSLTTSVSEMSVFVNGKLIECPEWGTYSLTFNDGDVLSIYYGVLIDAIPGVKAENKKAATYNLQGVKMHEGSKLPTGIYVKNGKKVVVR